MQRRAPETEPQRLHGHRVGQSDSNNLLTIRKNSVTIKISLKSTFVFYNGTFFVDERERVKMVQKIFDNVFEISLLPLPVTNLPYESTILFNPRYFPVIFSGNFGPEFKGHRVLSESCKHGQNLYHL